MNDLIVSRQASSIGTHLIADMGRPPAHLTPTELEVPTNKMLCPDTTISQCHAVLNIDLSLEWAPDGGHDQAAVLTVGRACCSSNCTGLRYPSAECSRLVL